MADDFSILFKRLSPGSRLRLPSRHPSTGLGGKLTSMALVATKSRPKLFDFGECVRHIHWITWLGAVFLHFCLGEIGAFPKMNHDLWGLVMMFQHIMLCWLSHIKIKVFHHLMQISNFFYTHSAPVQMADCASCLVLGRFGP